MKINLESKLGVVVVVIGLPLMLFFWYMIYTPTQDVIVINDTQHEVEASGCGSDILTLKPGESGTFDVPKADSHAACLLYNIQGNYSGCLLAPATPGSPRTLKVSALRRDIP